MNPQTLLTTFAKRLARGVGSDFYEAAASFVRKRRRAKAAAAREALAGNYRNLGSVAATVLALVREHDLKATVQVVHDAEKQQTATEKRFTRYLAQLAIAAKVGSYDEAAEAGRLLLADTYGMQTLRGLLGPSLDTVVATTAEALTRVGHYDEARSMIDRELAGKGTPSLLRARAEISWPHDREQALKDLKTLARSGKLEQPDALMAAYLDPQGAIKSTSGSFHLVRASRAHAVGDHQTFAREVNAFFNEQMLMPPLTEDGSAFSFARLLGNSKSSREGELVTVVMTAYNVSGTIGYAVRSVLAQTHANIELLIVDDCSQDSTWREVERLAAEDTRIVAMRTAANSGTYAAKNLALQRAKGNYITFHDADDWAHPQRVEVHLDFMRRHPPVLVTRSNWLRISGFGEIEFRRWRQRFVHANPASVFMRRTVIDDIGCFDEVRAGADSEFWYRAQIALPKGSVAVIPKCLGFGLLHGSSLTKSGIAKLDTENYSPVRAAYAAAYWKWYASADKLALRLDPLDHERRFPAPAALLSSPRSSEKSQVDLMQFDDRTLMFAISLVSQSASKDWNRTSQLLRNTLRSLLAQSDQRFTIAICGHERPPIEELNDARVKFIVAPHRPPTDSTRFRTDKMLKRRLLGSALREMGGGYFFPLDADDLVHRDFVAFARQNDNRAGFIIDRGYVLDFANRQLAPVPGAWSVSFDRVCGSSAALYFKEDELPVGSDLDEQLYFNLFQSHAYWPIVAEEFGRPLLNVPFPAAVYVVNHSQNLSFNLQREGTRTRTIIDNVRKHAVSDSAAILAGEFAFTF